MPRTFIIFILIQSIFTFLTSQASAYSGGDGSSTSPFQISTAADLLQLAADTGNYDKDFILTANISLAGQGDNFDGSFSTAVIAPDTDNSSDSFVGTEFEGVLDGNGKKIYDLTIDTKGIDNHHLGLFGIIRYGSEIRNLELENITIIATSSSNYVGGLCGKNYYISDIVNCKSSGSVTGGFYVGGLCGYNYDSIVQCSSSCTVTGNQKAGSLCGYNGSGATIDLCFATGNVTGSPHTIGALCGENFYGTISNSYATGNTADSSWSIRSLCSTNYGTIQKCYATQVAICNKNWGAITDCYWDTTLSGINLGSGGHPASTSDMMKAATFKGWNNGYWRINENISYPTFAWQGQAGDLITTAYPAASYPGNGTNAPFEISTPAHLVSMSQRPSDWDKAFTLTADIDMSSVSNYIPVTDFTGTIDGQGHVISNLTINSNVTNNLCQVALLGFIGQGGNVSNLGMENVTLTGQELVGGLCGMNEGGTIDNCYVTGSVTNVITANIAGGLCGYNHADIVDCYADVDVTGEDNLGGLCGWSALSTINTSYAVGDVSGRNHVGGLCGTNSGVVLNCYAKGNVTQSGTLPDSTGGLCGINWDMIRNCYATGNVMGTEGDIGGICGTNFGSNAAIENCFWNIEIQTGTTTEGVGDNPHSGTITNVLAKTTAEMQTQTTYTDYGWAFGTPDNPSIWKMPVSGYPVLTWQYNPVDMEEFAVLAQYWGQQGCIGTTPCKKADWFVDGIIDTRDLIHLSEYWLSDGITTFDPVNMKEYALLSHYWQMTGCDSTQPCAAADWYVDEVIDSKDLLQLAMSWLTGEMQIFDETPAEIFDGFETGDFSALNWLHAGGVVDWSITSDSTHEGSFAAKSGTVTHLQTSTIMLTVDTTGFDTISFVRKVSSEANYDFLNFFIDEVEQDDFSGELNWQVVQYPVSEGLHTFAWEYYKDGSVSEGQDCAWIDNIRIYNSAQ